MEIYAFLSLIFTFTDIKCLITILAGFGGLQIRPPSEQFAIFITVLLFCFSNVLANNVTHRIKITIRYLGPAPYDHKIKDSPSLLFHRNELLFFEVAHAAKEKTMF